jgi:hypothetical protein
MPRGISRECKGKNLVALDQVTPQTVAELDAGEF